MQYGAIFDMDGTLFDTESYYRKAWLKAAPEFGQEPSVAFTEAISGTSGNEFENVIKKFYPNIPDSKAYLNRVVNLVHEWSEEKLSLMEGTENILEFFKATNIKMAVASSSPTELIEKNLQRANLRKYFDAIVGGDQITNGKPAPDIFLRAANKINVTPQDCYVFEDSRNGILAAHAAKCIPILIVDQYKPDEKIKKFCAGVYDNFNQAIEVLSIVTERK
ncbi:MAG: HAD family phosphatase [Selenomonadaceae bacterium]|nr:HAD family phosphatase [Selenomonadaceae bacterium]